MQAPKDFYSPDQVATLLDLHVRTVRRFIRDGKLKATRIGKQYRIAAADLKAVFGQAPSSPAARDVGRTRSVLVSATADIEAISKEDSYRLATLLTGLFKSSRGESPGKRIECIYYEELGRLRVIVNADASLTSSVLSIIDGTQP